jgi:hypothetical protein
MYNTLMKIWKLQTQTPTHTIVRLNCEEHSDMVYAGEFTDDNALKEFFLLLNKTIDVEKNIKLLKYYGYLHLLFKREI